ncbi:MAG: hypothetical protein IPG52_02635 [Rhodocyclaceae bacterium]|nr:hypothetical protein [Rhodocyclaceae bacterium]
MDDHIAKFVDAGALRRLGLLVASGGRGVATDKGGAGRGAAPAADAETRLRQAIGAVPGPTSWRAG